MRDVVVLGMAAALVLIGSFGPLFDLKTRPLTQFDFYVLLGVIIYIAVKLDWKQ